jgi:hypothetical protein
MFLHKMFDLFRRANNNILHFFPALKKEHFSIIVILFR